MSTLPVITMKDKPFNLSKIVIDIHKSADSGADRSGGCGPGGCRPHIVICPGYGKENFPFPTVDKLVASALARVKRWQTEAEDARDHSEERGGETASEEDDDWEQADLKGGSTEAFNRLGLFEPPLDPLPLVDDAAFDATNIPVPKPKAVIPVISSDGQSGSGVDATLLVAAGGLGELLNDGKYDAIVAERFDEQSDRVSWARENMHPKYMPAIQSLDEHLVRLKEVYLASLPRTLDGLRAANPGVSEYQLLAVAIEALDEELEPIIDILRIWTDAFGQRRSGKYKELDAIVFCVEQAHFLFEGNDPASMISEENKSRLNTRVFRIGCVYVARFSSVGPATLPAGPIGSHAFEVPYDERNIIALMMILYMHEFRHDVFHDVEGLADELVAILAAAISSAQKSGQLKLSAKKVKIGNQSVPLLDLIIKLFVDTIGEVDADISGGVLLGGPAYLYNMLSTFSAMNSQGKGVFNTRSLLRTESFYELEQNDRGQMSLTFLPHPPDYIRAHIVAASLDEIGFSREAEECRKLADQAVGFDSIPQVISWRASQSDAFPVIEIPVSDLKAVAPIVAKALIRTPLKSLGGVATADVTNWTEEREGRAQQLARLLMAGKSELPTDIGHIHVTYVISASTIAYWGLCKSGYQPRVAAGIVQTNALKMIEQVRLNYERRLSEGAGK